MKRSIFALLVLIGALVISIASPLIFNQYVNKTQSTLTGDADSIISFEEAYMQVTNPVLLTAEDAVLFHKNTMEGYRTDSIFMHIPRDVVKTIATVLIGRTGQATKASIVSEFTENYTNTYKYLSVPESTNNTGPGDTIKLPKSITVDTIINGKPVKLIKEIQNNG